MEAAAQGAGGPGAGRLGRADWMILALLFAAFVPGLLALSRVWNSVEYYSHGTLVPLVAALLAWRERERLLGTPVARSVTGLGLLAVCLGVYAIGLAAGLVSLTGLALVSALGAAVLWLRGPAWLNVLAFPLVYLLFMVPIPEEWLQPVILQLRLLVTGTAVAVLHAVGIPVLREGNVIGLPGGESLFVADACSGVTSLVTLAPLGVLVAQLTERSRWRRVLMVLAVVPIALAFNLIRVLGTVIAAQSVGAERATAGAVHDAAGLLTYVVGCLALLGVGSLLRRLGPSA